MEPTEQAKTEEATFDLLADTLKAAEKALREKWRGKVPATKRYTAEEGEYRMVQRLLLHTQLLAENEVFAKQKVIGVFPAGIEYGYTWEGKRRVIQVTLTAKEKAEIYGGRV